MLQEIFSLTSFVKTAQKKRKEVMSKEKKTNTPIRFVFVLYPIKIFMFNIVKQYNQQDLQ